MGLKLVRIYAVLYGLYMLRVNKLSSYSGAKCMSFDVGWENNLMALRHFVQNVEWHMMSYCIILNRYRKTGAMCNTGIRVP